MNWVGGIRSRIKLKQEKKLQKEFFERKRLQKKLHIANPVSVNNATSSRDHVNESGQTISQDLLALQVIMQTHDKPYRSNREFRQPTKIDLDRPNRHPPKFKNEEILDLPLPSSAKPSSLEFSKAIDPVTRLKSPAYPFNQKEAKVKTKRKIHSYETDLKAASANIPPPEESLNFNENRKQDVKSVFQKRSKHSVDSEFSEHIDFATQVKKMKRKASPHVLGINAPRFTLTQENLKFNEDRKQNFDPSYAELANYSVFDNDRGYDKEKMKREDNSFELNDFENVIRSRQDESFLSTKRCFSDIFGGSSTDRYPKSNGNVIEKQHLMPKYSQLDQQSPFIPYAAPAPFSLAARSATLVNHQPNRYPSSAKSDYLVNRSTPPKPKQRGSQNNNSNDDHSEPDEIMETYQPISHSAKHENLFLAGRIHCDKPNGNTSTENTNYPLPSPETNDMTIACLNKSDPKSFLTDLQILEEIISEKKHQPIKANPDAILNPEQPSPQYRKEIDENMKTACTKMGVKPDEDNPEIIDDRSTDDLWRNLISSVKRTSVDEKQNVSHQASENVSSTETEKCSPRRSRIAAEELKEVMAVQQYESSQESSYNSSWSSSGSENEDKPRSAITKSGKLSSKNESKEINGQKTSQSTTSQNLPSTSTSEQLLNNGQNQVYTVGLSSGLTHLSKTKEIIARNPDQTGSNLSVFRIYPLSRSEEKSTQTVYVENRKVPVSHKEVQCEIWTTNPLACTHFQQDDFNGDMAPVTHEDRNRGTESKQISLKGDMGSLISQEKTGADIKQYILTDVKESLNGESKSAKTHSSSYPGLPKEIQTELKISNNRAPTPPIFVISTNCLVDNDVKNNTASPNTLEITKDRERKTSNQYVGYSSTNKIPDTAAFTKNPETLPEGNEFGANTKRLRNVSTLAVQDSDLETVEKNSTQIATVNKLDLTQDNQRKTSSQCHQLNGYFLDTSNTLVSKIIPQTSTSNAQSSNLLTTRQNFAENRTEKYVSSVQTVNEITAQNSDLVTKGQNSAQNKIERNVQSVLTTKATAASESKANLNDDKTTTLNSETNTVKGFTGTVSCSNSTQYNKDEGLIDKLKEDIERLQNVNVYQSIVIKSLEM